MTLKNSRWWLAMNAVALVSFLVLASRSWTEPELRGVPGASGGASVVWAVTALPVLLSAFLADAIWFALSVATVVKTGRWRPMAAIALAGAAWIVAVLIDQMQH